MDLRKIAQRATTVSKVMEGRQRLSMDEVINKYPNGVRVIEMDMLTNPATGEAYPVVATDMNDCFFGGKVLAAICSEWLNACEGDVQTVNDSLKECGGVLMRFERGKTKTGRSIVRVIIPE